MSKRRRRFKLRPWRSLKPKYRFHYQLHAHEERVIADDIVALFSAGGPAAGAFPDNLTFQAADLAKLRPERYDISYLLHALDRMAGFYGSYSYVTIWPSGGRKTSQLRRQGRRRWARYTVQTSSRIYGLIEASYQPREEESVA
jgi:hypothetical protein